MSVSPKGPTRGAPERANMAETAQKPSHIAGQCPDIGALAAFGLEHRMVRIRLFYKDQLVNLDLPRLQFHRLAVAGEVIGPLALRS